MASSYRPELSTGNTSPAASRHIQPPPTQPQPRRATRLLTTRATSRSNSPSISDHFPCAFDTASPRSSWLVSRLVFFWRRGANQRVWPRLDRRREFTQVVADLPQVVEQLVDIFRIHVQRLIEIHCQACGVRERLAQLDDRGVNVLAIVANQRIDVVERLVRRRRRLLQIVNEGL